MIRTKVIPYETRIRIFWMLVTVIVAAASLYLYALSATVRNTVARQGLELAVADLSSRESALEYKYLGLTSKISLGMAYAQGYQDISSPIYISKARTSLTMR